MKHTREKRRGVAGGHTESDREGERERRRGVAGHTESDREGERERESSGIVGSFAAHFNTIYLIYHNNSQTSQQSVSGIVACAHQTAHGG